jgi:8-oxo-dGTP pyrophosphatase MutT (NUDIX family)
LNVSATFELRVVPVARLEATLEPYEWPFVTQRAADIAANWARVKAAKPATFNGRVLLESGGGIEGDVFHARYFKADYASLLAWKGLGFPEAPGARIRNGFAMAALRSVDGAYLMGVMAEQTVNAGRIYFAAGTPDMSDVTDDGRVDLAGSALRELEEETGLSPSDVDVAEGWRVVLARSRTAYMRDVTIDLPADQARALILDRLSRQESPELSDIAIARSAADIDENRMPDFMQHFLRDAFQPRERSS